MTESNYKLPSNRTYDEEWVLIIELQINDPYHITSQWYFYHVDGQHEHTMLLIELYIVCERWIWSERRQHCPDWSCEIVPDF